MNIFWKCVPPRKKITATPMIAGEHNRRWWSIKSCKNIPPLTSYFVSCVFIVTLIFTIHIDSLCTHNFSPFISFLGRHFRSNISNCTLLELVRHFMNLLKLAPDLIVVEKFNFNLRQSPLGTLTYTGKLKKTTWFTNGRSKIFPWNCNCFSSEHWFAWKISSESK